MHIDCVCQGHVHLCKTARRPLPHKDPTSRYRHAYLICLIWSCWIHLSHNTNRHITLISRLARGALLARLRVHFSLSRPASSFLARKGERKKHCFFPPRFLKDLIKPKNVQPYSLRKKPLLENLPLQVSLFVTVCLPSCFSFPFPLTLTLFERERVAPGLPESHADNFGKLRRR